MAKSDKTKLIPIKSISLNRSNIRHVLVGEMAGEEETIAHLSRKEKIYELAKNICEQGINPLEIPGVVREGKGYIMLEGNRRLCALKLLNDPTLAKSQTIRKRYEKLAREATADVPDSLRCHVFANWQKGNVWMRLKHTSNQPAGVRPWSSEAQAYFDNRSANQLALHLKQYAINNRLYLKKTIDSISITTLTRYLSTRAVRECIGITDTSRLFVDRQEATFKKFLKAFLDDYLKGKLSSRDLVTARKAYAKELEKKVPHQVGRLKKPIDLTPKNFSQPQQQVKLIKKRPRKQKGIINSQWEGFAHLKENSKDGRIFRIAKELQNIDSDKCSLATGCLLRMLMECVIRRYLGISTDSQRKLKLLYGDAAKKLTLTESKRFVQPLEKAKSDPSDCLSPDIQSGWVHGRFTPTQGDLRKVWENFCPIIEKMLEAEAKH